MKQVIVLQGVSGSGKSYYARKLLREYLKEHPKERPRVISADDYFTDSNGYCFDPRKLPDAHAWCFRSFVCSLQDTKYDFIIVDNTNASAEELSPYMLACAAFYASATIVRVDCDLELAAKRNVHNVPTNAISRQADRIRESNDTIARRGWDLQIVNGDK